MIRGCLRSFFKYFKWGSSAFGYSFLHAHVYVFDRVQHCSWRLANSITSGCDFGKAHQKILTKIDLISFGVY